MYANIQYKQHSFKFCHLPDVSSIYSSCFKFGKEFLGYSHIIHRDEPVHQILVNIARSFIIFILNGLLVVELGINDLHYFTQLCQLFSGKRMYSHFWIFCKPVPPISVLFIETKGFNKQNTGGYLMSIVLF